MASYWLSSTKMTVIAKTDDDDVIVFTAKVTRKFIGQPLSNLERWMTKQGGFRKVQLKEPKLK